MSLPCVWMWKGMRPKRQTSSANEADSFMSFRGTSRKLVSATTALSRLSGLLSRFPQPGTWGSSRFQPEDSL